MPDVIKSNSQLTVHLLAFGILTDATLPVALAAAAAALSLAVAVAASCLSVSRFERRSEAPEFEPPSLERGERGDDRVGVVESLELIRASPELLSNICFFPKRKQNIEYTDLVLLPIEQLSVLLLWKTKARVSFHLRGFVSHANSIEIELWQIAMHRYKPKSYIRSSR